ncbi:MAG: DNA mismatch repair protein MutS [Elusimicrobia bacterium]|nr:DNA mismatch repair protein MutS [Elusimicrobiota bacterium]
MPTVEKAEDTPLWRQYKALKTAYPHALLLFRLGDFYELFDNDARVASPVLGIVLTQRQGSPMCGIPHHSATHYIAKLLRAGYKIAIADQMEDPSKAKGLVKRSVTRLITPGTLVEDEYLDSRSTNYLVALAYDAFGWGLACVEASTGEFWATQVLNDHGHLQLYSLLAKLEPAELIATPKAAEELKLRQLLGPKTALTFWEQPFPGPEEFAGFGDMEIWKNRHLALRAALKARRYVADTQSHLKDTSLIPQYRESAAEMQLDEAAIRTLELVQSAEGDRRHSLWGVLDRTQTPMGSRKLRHCILHPSTDLVEIDRRLNCVEELTNDSQIRKSLAKTLGEVADIERVINRMATRSASPRDLAALRDSLKQIEPLSAELAGCELCSGISELAKSLAELAPPLREGRSLLERAIVDRPPTRLSDGGLIREGFDKALDELRSVRADSRRFLAELEARERAATGIPTLKVGYNSVFGYYIEVTKAHQAKVPDRFSRKQTLSNAERYITPELKELEIKILNAEDECLRLEAELFERVRSEILLRDAAIRRFAQLCAELDVLGALADGAAAGGWAKPKVDLSYCLEIEDGRHPIVESVLPAGAFVPNSILLDGANPQTVVLTGPNMGGKSVFLRQNALLAILAQIGSFVPAKSASIGIVDKILTRIGSRDQLARGESTFMVEMRETSHILKSATLRSLILLDEVGRGTSTYDGISIAWAVLEHLNKMGACGESAVPKPAAASPKPPRGPRTLFATHYFELTELALLLPGVSNANVEAREWTNAEGRTEVVFLHKISPGPADRSFGIHVAELAGLPSSCLSRAREILHGLENEARAAPPTQAAAEPAEPTLPIFDEHPALHELRLLNPNELTPIEALNKLWDLKRKV